jgi:hypothetical protein
VTTSDCHIELPEEVGKEMKEQKQGFGRMGSEMMSPPDGQRVEEESTVHA